MHPIRGGLNYNFGIALGWRLFAGRRTANAERTAARTPAPQWVRVIGGWTEFQFAERRMPTLDEINAAAPDTPVSWMHLYDRAFVERSGVACAGLRQERPDFPAGEVQRDHKGNPTGLLIAKRMPNILYSTLREGPQALSRRIQLNSSRLFFASSTALASPARSMPEADFRTIPATMAW